MKQITLNIQDNKYPFFLELINSFDFVNQTEPDKEPTKEDILKGLQESVKEVKLIIAGKIKGIPARDLLNEF